MHPPCAEALVPMSQSTLHSRTTLLPRAPAMSHAPLGACVALSLSGTCTLSHPTRGWVWGRAGDLVGAWPLGPLLVLRAAAMGARVACSPRGVGWATCPECCCSDTAPNECFISISLTGCGARGGFGLIREVFTGSSFASKSLVHQAAQLGHWLVPLTAAWNSHGICWRESQEEAPAALSEDRCTLFPHVMVG